MGLTTGQLREAIRSASSTQLAIQGLLRIYGMDEVMRAWFVSTLPGDADCIIAVSQHLNRKDGGAKAFLGFALKQTFISRLDAVERTFYAIRLDHSSVSAACRAMEKVARANGVEEELVLDVMLRCQGKRVRSSDRVKEEELRLRKLLQV